MRTLNDTEIKIMKMRMKRKGTTTLRTAIYARKSAEDERQTSLSTQIAQCRALIAQYSFLSLDESNIFQEDNVSGMFKDIREQYLALIDKVERKEIDVVVVMKLDRMARDIADATNTIKLMNSYDCMLIAGDDVSDSSTPAGEFMRNILLAQNQYHARRTASDVMAAECHNAFIGDSAGGVPPFGLKVIKKRYEIDEKEAPAIRTAFEYISQGKSYQDIIDHLTNLGYYTRDGMKFSHSTLSTMLRNPKYRGLYIYNKEGAPKKKHRVLIEHFNEVRNETAIPPIISKELFDKVQSTLTRHMNCRPRSENGRFYFLTGFLYCSQCGSTMFGNTVSSRRTEKDLPYLYVS